MSDDTYPIRVRWPWGTVEQLHVSAAQFYIGDDPAYKGGPAYSSRQLKILDHVTLPSYRFPDPMPNGTPEWLLPAAGKTLEVLLEEITENDGQPLFVVSRIEKPDDLE